MSNSPLRMFVAGFRQKKGTQRNPICMTYADYDYILDVIKRCEKLSLNRM